MSRAGGAGRRAANLPDHELHLAFPGRLDENGDQLGVPWAKNAMRADGCGYEILVRIVGTQHRLRESRGTVWAADMLPRGQDLAQGHGCRPLPRAADSRQ